MSEQEQSAAHDGRQQEHPDEGRASPEQQSASEEQSAQVIVAITGITGFIGSALARAYLERGDQVRGLVRDSSEGARRSVAEELKAQGAHIVSGDLDDQPALDALCDRADVIIHCAAFMGKRDPELSERVNVTGTRRLLEASQRGGVGRFVYISSISVYRGTESETRVFSEEVEPQLHPRLNHYSRTKLLGEHLVTEYCGALSDSSAERPLSFTTIRPTNVYGPGCRPWGTSVERLTSRYHVCFGRVTFNFIHIDDLVRGIIALASHPDAANDAFNLAAEPVELWAFHRYIARRIGAWTVRVPAPIDGLIRHAIDLVAKIRGEVRSTGYTQRFIYPHDKTTRVCGYQPQHLIHAERD